MSPVQSALAAYRTFFDNLAAFAPIALAWALISASPSLVALFAATRTLPESEDATLLAIAPTLLTLLLSIAASACVSIVWYRFVIRGEPASRLFPATTEVVAPYVTRLVVASLPTVILATLIYWLSWEVVNPIQGASNYLATSVWFATTARLLLVLPASATGDIHVRRVDVGKLLGSWPDQLRRVNLQRR